VKTAGEIEARTYAIAARFDSAAELYEAARKVRDAGYRHWDVFSPFPIHGMDDAMGLGRSILSKFVFCGGLTGFLIAITLVFVPSSFLYPLVVAGKPIDITTVPAFFPIIFELTILLSAFTAVFGMLILNGLPRFNHPLFNWDAFKQVSADGFFLAIEARDPNFTEEAVADFLEQMGGQEITRVKEDV